MSPKDMLGREMRLNAWAYTVDQLIEPLPKWRRDEVIRRFCAEEAIAHHHSAAAAYWHRQTERARMAEVDRSKFITQLESDLSLSTPQGKMDG